MKSYTDIEQSKKLVEILPLESADMGWYYSRNPNTARNQMWVGTKTENADIPCWSLAALLNIIPQEIFNGEYVINITEGCDENWVITYDHIDNKSHSFYGLSTGAGNLIDACYKMILKLNELKIL